MRFGIPVVLTTLLFMAFSLSNAEAPRDFEMVIISEPVHLPEEIEQMRVDISANGEVTLHAYRNGAGEEFARQTMRLNNDALNAINDAIEENQFFGLDEFYGDKRIAGGDRASIFIRSNGREKEVVTLNIKVTDFDNIVRTLNEYLPMDRKIYYNAISRHADDYREVSR